MYKAIKVSSACVCVCVCVEAVGVEVLCFVVVVVFFCQGFHRRIMNRFGFIPERNGDRGERKRPLFFGVHLYFVVFCFVLLFTLF